MTEQWNTRQKDNPVSVCFSQGRATFFTYHILDDNELAQHKMFAYNSKLKQKLGEENFDILEAMISVYFRSPIS